ncbi:hypothetical protein [Sporomusa sp. KB1]|uniref:hypothetical protein n=1 Tax=Sporomusa sp. KB1 TaxID=943346 RepID=UPI0016476851|nr:hypothetical protein [Sporomusa sp. KB1]
MLKIIAGTMTGITVALITAICIAAWELGSWRDMRIHFSANNRNHQRRHENS